MLKYANGATFHRIINGTTRNVRKIFKNKKKVPTKRSIIVFALCGLEPLKNLGLSKFSIDFSMTFYIFFYKFAINLNREHPHFIL